MNQQPQQLASEQVVVSAPMSFHGSSERIWKITDRSDNALSAVGLGALAVALIAVAWCIVLCWYVVFSVFLIPNRLIRRGQRKRKLEELRHRELLATSTAAIAATTPPAVEPSPTQPQLESGDPR